MCVYLRVLDPMELELQAGVSCLMSVLGAELRSSVRAAGALKYWASYLSSP